MTSLLFILADALPADPQISGDWVLKLVAQGLAGLGSLFAAVWGALKYGEHRGEKKATAKMETTITPPIPPVTVMTANGPPSWDQHAALARRVGVLEGEVKEIRRDGAEQYRQIIKAGEEREHRLGSKIDDAFDRLTERIDRAVIPTKNTRG